MNKVDQVRALFVEGEAVVCVENTYIPDRAGTVFEVTRVGKTVYDVSDRKFRGTFPTRVSDVVSVDSERATWKIGRDNHTVTYAKVVR